MSDVTIHSDDRLDRLQRVALMVGAVSLAVGLIGCCFSRAQFFNAYLFAWFFVLGLPLGGLAIVMLHHLTGGNWGRAIRIPCEAAAMTLPAMLVLFLPVALGMKWLFPWADEEFVAHDAVLRHQSIYFNPTWFLVRAALYFAVWCVLGAVLTSQSREYQRDGDERLLRSMRTISAGGLLALVVLVTLATFDWVMSREAHFTSTVIGFMIAVGQTLSAMVFAIAILPLLTSRDPELREFLTPPILNDLGNLILTLVILWAYVSFSQLLVVWMGNIDHETPWYRHRGIGPRATGWTLVAVIVLVFHFFVPFFILLSREAKQQFAILTMLALGLLVMRALDVYWLVAPSGADVPIGRRHVSLLDLPMLAGVGGIWFYVFVVMLRRRGPRLLAREETSPEETTKREGGAAGANAA